ncbi:AraC family ligand binding domain-containing protein [Peristeroidobacter soli]|uniref:AraC family ligand binding domain-containing protein n=1 Tax=Peristeroidobacter soli TaxID=2497877 RepID=UPI001300A9ED|nr:AraC family ligand binding domain-containing protein [Peristeroidobacter soli]
MPKSASLSAPPARCCSRPVRQCGTAGRANGWRIEPHSHPQFGQIVFVRGGAGLMTVATDRRPFSSPSVLIVPVNTVHGFEYGMDSDGWVLTVAEPCLRTCWTGSKSSG